MNKMNPVRANNITKLANKLSLIGWDQKTQLPFFALVGLGSMSLHQLQ